MVQTLGSNGDDETPGRIDYQEPVRMTKEAFMAAQYRCSCGNSFDNAVSLAFHKAMAHLGAKG